MIHRIQYTTHILHHCIVNKMKLSLNNTSNEQHQLKHSQQGTIIFSHIFNVQCNDPKTPFEMSHEKVTPSLG